MITPSKDTVSEIRKVAERAGKRGRTEEEEEAGPGVAAGWPQMPP